ncbi:MAG: SCO family protein [Anaerolineales bacterium]
MKSRVLYSSIVASLLLVACRPYAFNGSEFPELLPAADFELMRADGQPYRLSDRQGRVVLIFFGYTSCPDVCPATLADAKRIIEGLGDQADQVDFLFVTVDPERDTPEVLGNYVANFHPGITALTGSPDALAAMREDYFAFAEKEVIEGSAVGYLMTHTARVFLVDPAGRLRLSYAFGTLPGDILKDVRYILKTET